MPSFSRLTEIAVYSIINFFPYIIIAVYPFKNHLRYSKTVTVLQIVLAIFVQIGLGIQAAFFADDYKGLLSIASTLIYWGFYLWVVKANLGKMLFTLLMLSNISNFIVSSSKCFEGIIFPLLAIQSYRWSFSAVMIVEQILILIPLFIYIKKKYAPAIEKASTGFMWYYLWLIPATFYLHWFHNHYYSSMSSLEIALQPSNTVFLLFINLGGFLVYCVVIRLVNEQAKKLELENNNHELAMQALQYENLQERITEASRAKHDMRHHFAMMTEYINNNNYEKLKDYLHSYVQTLSGDKSMVFCAHYSLNMLISYYAQLSINNNIDFVAHVNIPNDISILDNDLSVLLGNLLENAIDACCSKKNQDLCIVLSGRIENNCLLLTIDNTYEIEPKKNNDGIYLSSKHSGTGLGIESAKAIVKRYHGFFHTAQNNGKFYTSVLLKL